MKRLLRRAAKQLVITIERRFGAGPYARIRRLDKAVRDRQRRLEQLKKKVDRQQRQLASRRQRLSRLELERAARQHLVHRETWDTGDGRQSGNLGFSRDNDHARVEVLLDTAWSGWWEYGKDGLKNIAESPSFNPMSYDANIALAELYRYEGDLGMEVLCLQQAVRCRLPRPPSGGLLSQLAYLRIEQGDLSGGMRLVDAIDEEAFFAQNHILASNARMRGFDAADGRPDTRIDAVIGLNKIFVNHGFASVEIAGELETEGLPNLAPVNGADSMRYGPLVSVIVPAYNCANTLSTTLKSLLQQTWRSLEIIVVDDASIDATQSVARHLLEGEPRGRVIGNHPNSGAYVARNIGRREAKGEFITVCDAGDWVHPERIEHQVLDLLSSGHPFNWTQWIRADESMVFHPRPRGLADFVHNNPSSLLFRRAVFDACGEWDEIRVSGDTEFRTRVQEVLGVAPRLVAQGCPLAIGILEAGSLTQKHGTRTRARYRGVRRDYLESVGVVRRHEDLKARQELRRSTQSPLVVRPAIISTKRPQAPQSFDLLLVGDFSDSSCEAAVMIRIAERARARRSSVGLVHLPSRVGDVHGPSFWSRESVVRAGLEWVHSGDRVTSTLTVTTDSLPSWGDSPIDEFPTISSRRLWIIGRSRIVDGRFALLPTSRLERSLAGYFGRLPEAVRYLGDIAPYGGGDTDSFGLDATMIPGLRPLQASLLGSLAGPRGPQDRSPSATAPWHSTDTAMLLQCERCSDGEHTSLEGINFLAREAAERGLYLVVPTRLHSQRRFEGPGSEAIATIPRQDTGSLAERILGPSGRAQGAIYWPSSRRGTRQCWEPISAAADGMPVVSRALYGATRQFKSSGQLFEVCETVGDAFDALSTKAGLDRTRRRATDVWLQDVDH